MGTIGAWWVLLGQYGSKMPEVVAKVVAKREYRYLVMLDCSTVGGSCVALCKEIEAEDVLPC